MTMAPIFLLLKGEGKELCVVGAYGPPHNITQLPTLAGCEGLQLFTSFHNFTTRIEGFADLRRRPSARSLLQSSTLDFRNETMNESQKLRNLLGTRNNALHNYCRRTYGIR